jgi:hypothetical protein
MPKSRFDIANDAINIYLDDVGKFYDRARGLSAFEPSPQQTAEVLDYFSSCCAYCGVILKNDSLAWDYLIPVDKGTLGLHAWGNVVPCCGNCLRNRQRKTWREFVKSAGDDENFAARIALIESFVTSMNYDLNLDLHAFADSLYEDIGAIVMTLIQLRYKQSEQKIRATLSSKRPQRRVTEPRPVSGQD